jgi:hypothetical protein
MKSPRTILVIGGLLAASAVSPLTPLARVTVAASQAQAGRGQGAPTQDTLNKVADAVLRLKSAKFSLTREGTPAFLDEKNGITFTLAQCGYSAPDRVSCDVKVSSRSGTILQITRVWVPEGTFQSNPLTRQFAKTPPDATFNGALLFARAGIPEILRTSVQKVQAVGTERIRDRNTVHVKGDVRGDKLIPLMGDTVKADVMYPVDLWMDGTTSEPVRLHVTEPAGNGWLIELFALNEPVQIATPTLPAATSK